MGFDPSRPWLKPVHGLSKTGIVLFLVGALTLSYGFVNQALVSVADDQQSVRLMDLARELDAAADAATDPAERERLRQRANDVHFEADNTLIDSRSGDANAAMFTIAGIVITLIGLGVMVAHRHRTKNLV
jgi:hypothetical protein